MGKIETRGYILEKDGGKIIAITPVGSTHTIRVGQEVVANGRMFFPAGTKGKVIKIYEPHTEGLTSDVIEVQFEGEPCGSFMKFKDLLPYRWSARYDLRYRRCWGK